MTTTSTTTSATTPCEECGEPIEPERRWVVEMANDVAHRAKGFRMACGSCAGLRDVTVTLTSHELNVLQDVLKRQQPGGLFTGRPSYATALGKIQAAAWVSYGKVEMTDEYAAEWMTWAKEDFPASPEFE